MLPGRNYDEQDYLQDEQRIQTQIQKVDDRIAEVEREMAEDRQAKLDREGLEHFCHMAANNLDKMTDSQWRLLLEAMNLKVVVVGKTAVVQGSIPVSNGDIVLQPARR